MTQIAASETQRTRAYPEYRDSGVEWLGEIPAHWDTVKLKWATDKIGSGVTPKGGSEAYVDAGITFLRSQNVYFDGLRLDDVAFIDEETDKEMAGSRVKPWDVLLNITGASLGRCALVPADFSSANVNQHVCIIRAQQDKLHPPFLNQVMASDVGQQQIFAEEDGASREAVTFAEIGDFVMPRLPLDEQRAIAAYLDRETERINTLVAKKERLIELLQEKRTALISRAVTKGLDPDVEMQDSGVDWLGEIPAHWDVVRFRYYCSIRQGQVDPKDEEAGDRVLIAPNHIESGTGRIINTETASEQGAISGKYAVKPGEIIYSKIRPRLNKVCVAEGNWLCSADMYPIQPDEALSARYLMYFMLSRPFVRLMVNESMRVAMPKVNRDTLSAAPLLLPPKSEQRKLVDHLDEEIAKIDALVDKVQEGIERLQEYRIALISAAVTGQIDVRDAVRE